MLGRSLLSRVASGTAAAARVPSAPGLGRWFAAAPAGGGGAKGGKGKAARTVRMAFEVKKEAISAVIGHAGEMVQSIRKETGTRIAIDQDSGSIQIFSDDREKIVKARGLIDAIVTPFVDAASVDFEVPSGNVGSLIGPKGSTIRRVTGETGVLDIIVKASDADDGTSTVRIVGSEDKLEGARAAVEALIATAQSTHDTGYPPGTGKADYEKAGAAAAAAGGAARRAGGGKAGAGKAGTAAPTKAGIRLVVKVPSDAIGLVIGPGGANIRGIRDRTGELCVCVCVFEGGRKGGRFWVGRWVVRGRFGVRCARCVCMLGVCVWR